MHHNINVSRQFLIDNFAYRLGGYHPSADIQVGTGNPAARVLVVQPHRNFPERDAITGALKRFGMLDDAFRTTKVLVNYGEDTVEYPDLVRQNARGEKPRTQDQINRAYLIELIELIRPIIVIACGPEVTAMLLDKSVRLFGRYAGKKIKIDDLTSFHVCAILNPVEYGFARASERLKQQGKEEWEAITRLYEQEKKKREELRWQS